MLTLKIGICDDDELYCKDIENKLDRFMIANDINISYHTYKDAGELLKNYTVSGTYDVLFLDVEMPAVDGLALAEKIKKIDRHIYIVFISNYPKYMQDSFRIHPFYYLIKPLSYDIFSEIMTDIISNIEREHKLVTLLQLDEREETINIRDIRLINVHNGKRGILCFHFLNHETLVKGTLQEWTDKLADFDFFQCHRSILLNMIHIHYFESNYAIMDNGKKVPLSRNRAKKLKNLYSNNILKLKNL